MPRQLNAEVLLSRMDSSSSAFGYRSTVRIRSIGYFTASSSAKICRTCGTSDRCTISAPRWILPS